MLIEEIREVLTKAKTEKELRDGLALAELTPYDRNGKLTGVYLGKRKYRFKTLGLQEEVLEIGKKREENPREEPTKSDPQRDGPGKDELAQNQEKMEVNTEEISHPAEPEITRDPVSDSLPEKQERVEKPEQDEIQTRLQELEELRRKEEERERGG